MTRRNEDSGLIDLDALMRQATAREAVELHEARPQSGRASAPIPAPTPTPAPIGVRSRPVEAPASRATSPETPLAKTSRQTPPIVLDRRPANDVRPAPGVSRPHEDVGPLPAAPPLAKVVKPVPPAPATMPSKLQPDSLEAVTTEPGADPWIAPPGKAASAEPAPAGPPTATKPEPKRSRSGLAMGAVLALFAVAGIGLLVRSRPTAVTPAIAAVTSIAVRSDAQPKAPAAPANDPPSTPGLSADELPAVTSAAPALSARVAATRGAPATGKTEGKPAPAATLTEAALESGSTSGAGDLGDAMRGAVGPRDHANTDTGEKASGPNASQVRPSPGAVVGALGSVLPAARACLSPDDPVRSGLVVFKSDGTVARVELKGAKPEDECVRSALAKAKVAPFVDETFSTRVTVRP